MHASRFQLIASPQKSLKWRGGEAADLLKWFTPVNQLKSPWNTHYASILYIYTWWCARKDLGQVLVQGKALCGANLQQVQLSSSQLSDINISANAVRQLLVENTPAVISCDNLGVFLRGTSSSLPLQTTQRQQGPWCHARTPSLVSQIFYCYSPHWYELVLFLSFSLPGATLSLHKYVQLHFDHSRKIQQTLCDIHIV